MGVLDQSSNRMKRTKTIMRKEKGVTLLEVALVLVILGILAGLAAPRFFALNEDADAETVRSIASDIEMSLTAALNRGLPYASLRDPGAAGTNLNDVISLTQGAFGSEVAVAATGLNTVGVTIQSQGGNQRTATLTLQNNGTVHITAITNFTRYQVNGSGDLERM